MVCVSDNLVLLVVHKSNLEQPESMSNVLLQKVLQRKNSTLTKQESNDRRKKSGRKANQIRR